MPKNYDSLIEDIYQVLPADSVADIAKKTHASPKDVELAIKHLRKYCKNYGWTIPHVSSNNVKYDPSQKGKYFAVILEKDSSSTIDNTKRLHYTRGSYASLVRASSQLTNLANALLAVAKNERAPNKRYMLESIVKDLTFVKEKAEHAAEQFGT
jgi:hypothetical protein